MLQNRPRGIIQNKNAANIQLAGACLKPQVLSLQSVNAHSKINDNVIEKPFLRQLESKGNKQVDSENVVTLASLKSLLDPVNSKSQNEAGDAPQADPKKVSMLENFDKESLNLINLDGRNSPKEPSPPKLKSRQRPEPEQRLPLGIIDEREDKSTGSAETDDVVNDKSKQTISSNDECDYGHQKPSGLSRIPRLSLRFSNAPPIAKPNILKQQLNKAVNISRAKAKSSLVNQQLNKARAPAVPAIVENDKENEEEDIIEDIDKSNSRDAIYLVCDVAKDIYNYMYELERAQSVNENYLKDQRILTPKVRQRLINWCIEINSQLKLLPETLYITIATIDRFFDKFVVERQDQVQLFASAATLIASKYEEIYPPEVRDLVYLTQQAYTKREILRAEMQLLKTLDFDLGKPIPLAFLRRFSKAAHCNLKMHSIAKYLMELSLTEYECCHWEPSLLAAAALFTSLFLVAACKNDSLAPTAARPLTSTTSSRVSLAPLPFSARTNSKSVLAPSVAGSSSSGRITRSRLSSSNSYVSQIVDRVWTKQMVHYTRYNKDQLHGPASILCKILKRSQKNPQQFYSVKKNASEFSKWVELKSTKVDDLILMTGITGANSTQSTTNYENCKSA